ncbi:DUF2501 domain-containing protein [Paraburkholderia acidipaludis]|uniref:DUF2501 domain-containing protein n=1 Tax=Paraburkholderia acidipaludis TaxID=660537 RepID=UPI000482C55F|nr:DUF2501 domain-containing protein [Paraburkholderia acidipaludis]
MQTSVPRALATLAIALALPVGVAHAQLGNLLNQGGNSGSAGNALGALGGSGGSGGLGSLAGGSSLTSGSLGNVTGLLQYCIKNNYLSADSASGVKNSLLSKLPGGANTTDSGYTQGSNGILTSGSGSQVDLSGGGLKEAATRQVCDKILAQGKSML